jgi:hypothetical protein
MLMTFARGRVSAGHSARMNQEGVREDHLPIKAARTLTGDGA